MYMDILGFSNLINDKEKVETIYRIIDNSSIHEDSNYRVIVFSDTILI